MSTEAPISTTSKQVGYTIGKLIQCARKEAKMTQQDLAERVGISRQTVNNIEKGSLNVNIGSIIEACYILNIPLLSDDKERINTWLNILSEFDALLPARTTNKKVNLDDNF